jgi:hypothetical protein
VSTAPSLALAAFSFQIAFFISGIPNIMVNIQNYDLAIPQVDSMQLSPG